MAEFRRIRIADLGRVVTGSTPPTANPENFGPGYHFIKPPDLHEERRRVFETETEISEIGAQTQQNRLLPENTPCVVCIGTIGKIGLTSRPSFTNQQINSIIVDQARHDPVFVYYLLRDSIPRVKQLNAGSASGRENVNKSTFENIELLVPPLLVQRRIAGILSAYDELIENSQRRIRILDSMARALYREWFVHFRFPGHESVPRVPSPLGEIPEGWACVCLADVGELTVGGDWGKDTPEGNEWVEVGCLRGVDLHAFAKAGFSEVPVRWIKRSSLEKRRVGAVDVLVEGSGECGRSLAGGDHLEVLIGHPVVYSNFCKRVRFRDAVTARYVEHLLNSMVASGEMTQYTTGTTIPNLNMRALFETHHFLLPSVELLRYFVGLLASSDAFKFSGRIQNLRRTRDLLLPRLLSGQIDVEAIAS